METPAISALKTARKSAACELTILMPCLNEAETLAVCIDKAQAFLETNGIDGEVLIADNGSTDGSQAIAHARGARVVEVHTRGYGGALLGGIEAARGRYVIMGDADDSYDFRALSPFLEKLRQGYDLVMGNRFKGGIKPGAMPALHRYVGNPVLTGFGRLFFQSPVGDFHCGLRGFTAEAIRSLKLRTTGMEFASEMVVKATLHGLRIAEVPTTLSPDGRSRAPHLRSWRDGWRHLRFLLIFCPRWLFLYPGLALMLLGFAAMVWLIPGPRIVGQVTLDIHTMLYASAAMVLGLQAVAFSIFSKIFTAGARLIPEDNRLAAAIRVFTLERGIVFGALLTLTGLVGSLYSIFAWGSASFGELLPSSMMRVVIPSLTALTIGVQVIFAAFFLSTLRLVNQ
jgi:glycosyltransferase involved in cell wall biosynthesis